MTISIIIIITIIIILNKFHYIIIIIITIITIGIIAIIIIIMTMIIIFITSITPNDKAFFPETKKYRAGIHSSVNLTSWRGGTTPGQRYWKYRNKSTSWGRCFITSHCTLSYPVGLIKTEPKSLDQPRLTVVVVSNVVAHCFMAFSDLTCHLEDTRIGVFWLHSAA